ncbi:MAG: EAL domain-containing protein [Agarilytica sp.]
MSRASSVRPCGILVHRDFKPLYLNHELIAMLGYRDAGDLMSLPSLLGTLWREEDQARVKTAVADSSHSAQPQIFYCAVVRADRTLINLQVYAQNIDWQGEPAQQLLVSEGLDRAAVALALAESEERLRLVFNQQFQFMAILSPEGRVIEINDLPLAVMGASRESCIGQYFWKMPAWQELPEWQRIIQARVIDTGKRREPFLGEDMFLAKGEVRYANSCYTGIRDERDRLQYILVQASDTTEQKAAEAMLNDSRQRLDLALATARMGTWEMSFTSGVLWWAEETCKIFGIEPHEFGNSFESYMSFVPEESRSRIEVESLEIMRQSKYNDVFLIEHEFLRKDGSRGTVEVRGKMFLGEDNRVQRVTGICTDISESRAVTNRLNVLYRAMESSPSSVIITNTDRVIEYVNQKFTHITGYKKHEVTGKNISILNSSETSEDVYRHIWDRVNAGLEWKGELKSVRKDGSFYWERASVSAVKNDSGQHTHYISIQEDVTHEYELSEKLSHQASHDALTGLINRYEFERYVEGIPSVFGEVSTKHALCFLDLDQFKLVNDTCGHLAGDNLLRQLSAILREVVEGQGVIGRLGGDEFAVFMVDCSVDAALNLANRILKAVQDFQFAWEGHVFRIGVSIGLVPVESEILKMSELLKHADAACYMAKDLGRNRIHVYYPDDRELNLRHGEMQWASRIYRALDENLFTLHAQLIGAMDTHKRSMYEVLVRMRGDDGEIIPPGAFIPAAERFNLISKVDCWVVENTLKLLAKYPDFLDCIEFISINLSGHSLADEATRDFVITQIAKHKIDASKICLEITETAAVLNLSAAEDFMTALKFMGCRFALDDFGSGVSSFGYLKKIPVDYLKIDGMFVRDIAEDPIDHAMVKSINEIGHVMGMMTIAEFVENSQIQDKLKALGVDYVQGFGVGRPTPFEEIITSCLGR